MDSIFPATGPGDSALKIWKPPMPSFGSRPTVKTSIPIPPIQWVIDLQRTTDLGKDAMPDITVAPVVVKPDTISKKESRSY